MLSQFGTILIFLIIGVLVVAGAMFAARILRPHRPNAEKLSTYECGEDTIGPSWVKFNIRFYVVALIFLIFDVEVVFLFPWALVYKNLGMYAFIEMMIFLLILVAGYVYVWGKGDLDWDKPRPKYLELMQQKVKANDTAGIEVR
ncbi:MAG: NADH-quinone oxidoreductase subunit A [Candidatus Kryptoniota bacterium]